MPAIITVTDLTKTYASGFTALKGVNLEIEEGEIFALLGPNGAGKTTLINIICGIAKRTSGTISVNGLDNERHFRDVRAQIGLVPQELTADMFETVWSTVNFSRGLFGKKRDHALVERVLRQLSLWDKKDNKIMTLSGGMKRRLLIAKALAHEPRILFLDEPTAGVDVELRRDMWQLMRELRADGVTIILTTHYIEEAEQMADRVGIISKGEIVLVERKQELMRKLGRKRLVIELHDGIDAPPGALAGPQVTLAPGGRELIYTYDSRADRTGITALLNRLRDAGLSFTDLRTEESSLEDIFVDLIKERSR